MLNIMIVLVGICKKNDTNIRILWNSLTLLTNCVGIVPGAIECLYYLLENDKLALMIMAESEHSYKRTKLKSLELLV